ncbi:MAG: alkaline phosphatase family protein [Betaproteobacteria bacterium]|nr:alkaline phosphatase family protein [Betaproteobacteria bacterium]
MVLPDYDGGGFANLIASCVEAAGGVASLPGAALAPPAQLAQARNIILLLIDGLGHDYLTGRGQGSALAGGLAGKLTSVFPSTTASAITTSYTGRTPYEHGITGWHTYFSEVGGVVAPLPCKRRGSETALSAGEAQSIYSAPSMFDRLARRSIVVTYRPLVESAYNRHHCGRAERRAYDKLGGLVSEIEAAVKSGGDAKFIYAYWPDFDTLSHRHGVGSPQTAAHFAAIDAAYAELLRRLAGTESTIVASADHGFIDCAPGDMLDLTARPALAALLREPLCGERRTAFCHVLPGRKAEFMARAEEWLEYKAEVRECGAMLAEGWFGGGAPHPRIAERVGDVALLMRERYSIIDRLPGEKHHVHIGNHGGTSAEEMYVPLILAEA